MALWQVVALPVIGFIGDIPRARASGASHRTLLQRLFTASSTPAMAHAAYTPSPTLRNGHTQSPLLHPFSPPSRAIAAIQARCQWTVPVSSFMLRHFPQASHPHAGLSMFYGTMLCLLTCRQPSMETSAVPACVCPSTLNPRSSVRALAGACCSCALTHEESRNPALLSVRSAERGQIEDALTTLIVTNLAYCAITIYQGLAQQQLVLFE
jgi:hypothetical protein